MAENTVKVNIVANTTPLDKSLAGLKKKLHEAFIVPTQFSLGALSPWKLASDLIVKGATYIIDTFRNAGEELKKQGHAISEEAKALDTMTERVANLKAAAAAAGVSTNEYADALERIKGGTITLEEQVEAWRNISKNSDFAKERARNFAAIRIAQEEKDEKNLIEQKALDARVKDEDRLRARLDELAHAYGSRGERYALGVEEMQQMLYAGNYRIDEETLSKMPAFFYAQQEKYIAQYEQKLAQETADAEKAAEERRKRQWAQEAEDNRIKAEQAAYEAKLKADSERRDKEAVAFARRIHAALERTGGNAKTVARIFGLTQEEVERQNLLAIASRTPEERLEVYQREMDRQAREREEKANADRAERERTLAERERLSERAAELQKRVGEVEGELNASWLTQAGGSLIGGGAFSLAMGQRMRAIDREEKQQELLQELHGMNDKLAQLVKNTNE